MRGVTEVAQRLGRMAVTRAASAEESGRRFRIEGNGVGVAEGTARPFIGVGGAPGRR
jgi:hypothetical protein